MIDMNMKPMARAARAVSVAVAVSLWSAPDTCAEYKIDYKVEALGNVGDGTFAPSYIAANRHGVLTQTNTILFRGGLSTRGRLIPGSVTDGV